MISPQQIRAARALLNWSAKDLATRCGLARETISLIEQSKTNAKEETVEKMARALMHAGVEFTANQGVRLKPSGIEIYEGQERFQEFYDFLYSHMLDHGGEVCLSVVDEKLLAKYRKNPEVQRQRMRELVRSGHVSYRVLVTEGDFTGDYVEYRQQPAHAAAPTAFYAFGECLALISFPQDISPHVVVIQSEPLTQAYRQAFHAAWEKAKIISKEEIAILKNRTRR